MPPLPFSLQKILAALAEKAPAAAEDVGQMALNFGKRFPTGEAGKAAASAVTQSDAAMDALVGKLQDITPERLPLQKARQLELFPTPQVPRTGAEVKRMGAASELVGPELAPDVENAIRDVINYSKQRFPGSVGKKLEVRRAPQEEDLGVPADLVKGQETGVTYAEPADIDKILKEKPLAGKTETVPVEKAVSPEDLEQAAYGLILRRKEQGQLPEKPGQLYRYLYPKLRKMADFEVKDMIEPVTVPAADRAITESKAKLEKLMETEPDEGKLMAWLKGNIAKSKSRQPKSLGEVLEGQPQRLSADQAIEGGEVPTTLGDTLPAETKSPLEELMPEEDLISKRRSAVAKIGQIKDEFSKLPARQQAMVAQVLGLEGEPMSQAAVAREFGISQPGVNKAIQAAIRKLRAVVGIPEEAPFTGKPPSMLEGNIETLKDRLAKTRVQKATEAQKRVTEFEENQPDLQKIRNALAATPEERIGDIEARFAPARPPWMRFPGLALSPGTVQGPRLTPELMRELTSIPMGGRFTPITAGKESYIAPKAKQAYIDWLVQQRERALGRPLTPEEYNRLWKEIK